MNNNKSDRHAIEELRRLLEASTPGEWITDGGECGLVDFRRDDYYYKRILVKGLKSPIAEGRGFGASDEHGLSMCRSNARFIAAAHNTLPLLFAELDRLRDENRQMRECTQMETEVLASYKRMLAKLDAIETRLKETDR